MGKILLLAFLSVSVLTRLGCVSVSVGISEDKKQEYDFEDLDVESITPNVDINYERDAENLAEDLSCECGISPSSVDLEDILTIRAANKTLNVSQLPTKSAKVLPLEEIQPLIIGGDKALKGEIPWMVAITKYQHKKIPRWKVICGGVLLNQRYVLTAAHCVHDRYKDTLELVFNVDNATAISADREVIRRKIERFIIHPAYNSVTIDSDIAIIEMKTPLDLEKLKSKVRPICLSKNIRTNYANRVGTVSGWGYTSYPGNDNSPDLLKVELSILSRADCLRTKVSTKNNVTENMFCAGNADNSKDACINDSGGPLTVQEGEKSYLAGLVSWGVGCSVKGYPGVYTNVPNFNAWIRENVKSRWCRE